MSRDYKYRAQPKRRRRAGIDVWRWLLVAVLIAVFVGFLSFLREASPPTIESAHTITAPIKPEAIKNDALATEESSKPRYDFYTVLPEKEVVVPEQEVKTRTRAEKMGKASTGIFVIQAGSFRDIKDADKRKAQLALLGVESQIEPTRLGPTVWNRLKIGPFNSIARADEIRSRLKKNNIDAVVIKGRNGG